MSQLKSLSEIFEHRLIRIPDYQRGFAWNKHQLNDFWEDLLQLGEDRVHYTGVITLEPASKENYQRWEDDLWLIEGKGYKPYYVVDGQQRLTTSMILIQAILETVDDNTELNYQLPENIRQQYVLQTAPDGLRRSFLFGYEKDNPSDEYLRTQIFNVHSSTNHDQQTFYTKNLAEAKQFFSECLKPLELKEIAAIYKKLTQKFKFNLYEIDAEIDVFVTFETMNNRGKPLSSLELLKNRLIYLSTLFHDNDGHQVLRAKINDSWKTIYEFLGKNSETPLSDNLFLRNHWTMYFKYTRRKGDDYINFLLDEKFTARNVTHPKKEEDRVTIEDVTEYVVSLQQAIKPWFYMHNPYVPLPGYDNSDNKLYLDRLDRLSFRSFKPLILAVYCSNQSMEKINALLKAAERYNFTLFSLSQRRANTGDTEFFGLARGLLRKEVDIDDIVKNIEGWVDYYYSPVNFARHIEERYEIGRDGYYHWDGIRYLLFEYEQCLRQRGKQSVEKLSWKTLSTHKNDHVTLEHIYPQTESDYWTELFDGFNSDEKRFLAHSLGNLVPLSRSKNSSLQNDSFPLKKNNGNGVGYYNGSVSENEIAQVKDWDAKAIEKRGLEILAFMEERWSISLGDRQFKKSLLCLKFLTEDTSVLVGSAV
jgi:uncharacterized protein with ParB-like and HNH nuclease domain